MSAADGAAGAGTVLVTGATGGIGRALVRHLVDGGWNVLATDLASEAELDVPADRARYVAADVTRLGELEAALDAAADLGTLVGCVANAGILTEDFTSFLDASERAWRSTFDVNVIGVLNTFKAAARRLGAGGGGRMVATASVAGVRAEPNLPAYCASKAAVVSIVRSLALELGALGITVNAVAPGPVETEAQRRMLDERARARAAGAPESAGERFDRVRAEERPLARLATPDDVAAAFSWLLSDAAAYVTGQVLVVDGGSVLV